uniref:Uncharacterized protein n=1 Tax=Arundo donax TaxID=35708 RepID=A0A0A9BF85_ARUDO
MYHSCSELKLYSYSLSLFKCNF